VRPLHPSRHLINLPVLSYCICALAFWPALPVEGQALQPSSPTVVTFHLRNASANAPVRVSGIMVGDKEIGLDTPVTLEGLWIRKIQVMVQNTSPKAIVEGGINVVFPETGDGTANKPVFSSLFSTRVARRSPYGHRLAGLSRARRRR
jgi:hypothetical protein